ncbi:OmpA family protein [Zemynaea arenosa]|nr:OmpA family protein [Massilia arenosa]
MKMIAFASALLCSAGVMAQDATPVINPSWYIQPSIVGMKPDGDFGTDKRAWGGGLKFGKAVSPMWDIQLGGSYVRDNDGNRHYRQTLLGADALLMLSRQNFRPFILFGVGAQRDDVENPLRNATKTSPYFTAGVGFQVGMNDHWNMQVDLRSVRGRLRDGDQAFGFDRSNNKLLTIGFNYLFDVPPPPAPPAPPPAPAPAPVAEAPQPAPVAPPPPPPPARFEKVTLSATELFEFDSDKLRGEQMKLDEIANALNTDTSVTNIMITGYADRIGSKPYNQKLSERRAVSVKNYLVGKGIDGSRLQTQGRGEENPVVQCNQKKRSELIKCLEPNRRVEVEQITIEKRVQ